MDLNRSRKSIDNDMFNGVVIIDQPDEKMLSYGLGVFLKLFLINQFLKQSYQSHIQKNAGRIL